VARKINPADGDHQIADIIGASPNDDQTTQEFWGGIGAQPCGPRQRLCREAIHREPRRRAGAAADQHPPDRTHNRSGDLEYCSVDRGKEEWLPRDKVFTSASSRSARAISVCRRSRPRGRAQHLARDRRGDRQDVRAGHAGLRFLHRPALNADQREDFTRTFIDPIGQRRQGALRHPGERLRLQAVNIPPKDAEMLLSRRFNVEEICRFMGTPPILVGHSGEGRRCGGPASRHHQRMADPRSRCVPVDIEKSINKRLLSPAERKRLLRRVRSRRAAARRQRGEARVPLEDDPERADDAERGPQEGQPAADARRRRAAGQLDADSA
jgi:hypothetical protein